MKQNYHHLGVEVGKRNLNAPHHWELLDLDNLKFVKPTVLCLSGNYATTNRDANAFAKQVENYLGLMFAPKQGYHKLDHLDIVGVKYSQYGDLSQSAINKIANAILLLLIDKNGYPLDINTAKKNMSRITFFTFCAGNKALQSIINNLNEKLLLFGYTENEAYAINNATLEVAYAPLNVLYNRIPSVRVISKKDEVVGELNFALLKKGGAFTGKQDNDGIHLHRDKLGSLNGINRVIQPTILPNLPFNTATAESIQITTNRLLNTYDGQYDEHYIAITARDQDWKINPTKIKNALHYAPNADCVSQMMAWALCKGVENSLQNFKAKNYVPNTYWHEMVDDFQSIINSYAHKTTTMPQAMEIEK